MASWDIFLIRNKFNVIELTYYYLEPKLNNKIYLFGIKFKIEPI